jgi:hypothetical protein
MQFALPFPDKSRSVALWHRFSGPAQRVVLSIRILR